MAARRFMSVRFGREWDNVADALGAEDNSVPRRGVRIARQNAEELADKAKRRVRRLPVRGGAGRTGLRRRVAAGVQVLHTPGGARVVTSMPERDESIIPRGLDRAQGWRHPVFGNRSVWVRQRPMRSGWFSDTMADGQDEYQDDLEDMLQDSVDYIASRGNQRGVPGV